MTAQQSFYSHIDCKLAQADKQRNKSVNQTVGGNITTTKYYIGSYEKETGTLCPVKEYDYIYTPEGLGAIVTKTGGSYSISYVHTDHLGSPRVISNGGKVVLARYSYDAWGKRTLVAGTNITNRGFTGHEHIDEFGLINMNARLYDPTLGRFISIDPYVQMPDFTQSFNRYSYALNNPLSFTDPSGEFITWSIGKHGFSIGFNLTPIGIPLGAGINIGWSNGGSVGFYGEVGYRVGGTGLGAGATISQSFDYGLGTNSWSTTTSVGAYGSLGMFNAGGNVSYTYGKNGGFNWGVSAGINLFGTDAWGLGLNIGYGSGGWDFGIGGYYNPYAWRNNPVYEPDKWNAEDKVDYNNCYSYALDDIDNGNFHGLQPGDAGGFPITSYSDINLDYVSQASISDGRIKQPNFWNKLGFGKRGYYSVYLVIDQGKDYHWYRQDKGGTWSHKPGRTPVINVDRSGRSITNPFNANHGNYNSGGRFLWVRRRR